VDHDWTMIFDGYRSISAHCRTESSAHFSTFPAPKFSEALAAYHTLSDPQLRRQHDIYLGTPTRQSNVIPEPLFAPERSWPDYRHSGAYQFDIVGELFELIESELDFSIRVSRMFF
jgi:curved DNA-binding protein CbpA